MHVCVCAGDGGEAAAISALRLTRQLQPGPESSEILLENNVDDQPEAGGNNGEDFKHMSVTGGREDRPE